MTKLTYSASGPGQASEIRIDGQVYKRGKSYTVSDELAANLLRRGGFYRVEKPRRAKAAKTEME